MAVDRTHASSEQARALANPLRLRILRLCQAQEWTNQQLAARLECDPSTVLYHVRMLRDAGFLEATEPRRGPSGALEKPYRSTGLSWTLDLGGGADGVSHAILEAFRAELMEAGPDSVEEASRFVLHLDDPARTELIRRIQAILDELGESDDARRLAGHPAMGGIVMLHRLRDPS